MGWFIAIGVIIAIIVCAVKNSKKNEGSVNNDALSPFKISVQKTNEVFQGTSIEIFSIKGIGKISVPFDNYPVIFITTLFDITDGTKKPIISTVKEFSIQESMVFAHKSDLVNIPYRETSFKEWVPILKVPTEILMFPQKGSLTLSFEVIVTGIAEVAKVTQRFSYYNSKPGYNEIVDDLKKAEEVTVKVAINMCGSDGDFDDKEIKIISDWINKKSKNIDGKEDSSKRDRLRNIQTQYIKKVRENGAEDLDSLSKDINAVSNNAYKFEIIELLIDIASADGVYRKEEQDLIIDLSKKININFDRVRSMIDKKIDITIYEGRSDIDSQLGLNKNMTVEEKKESVAFRV